MLKWVVTAGANTAVPRQGTNVKHRTRVKAPSNSTQASPQNELCGVNESDLGHTHEFEDSSVTKKRTSTSGEADSLLDNTDSFSDDFQAQAEVSESGTACDNSESRSHCGTALICHGQNQDSGICTDISHDPTESCYNSGTDTSFDTSPGQSTFVTIVTGLNNGRGESREQEVEELKGKNKAKCCSQITTNGLCAANETTHSDSSNLSKEHKTQPDEHQTTTFNRAVITCDSRLNDCDGKKCDSDNDTDSSSVDICEFSVDFPDECPDDSDVILGGYKSDSESLDDVFDSNHPFLDKTEHSKNSADKLQGDNLIEQENVHQKRSRLVEQIDREQKLKTGAENLFKASENRRLKETIAVEIRFIESHIKLLTDELADLDFSMESKQPEHPFHSVFPMIQLGFKETKDVDCRQALKSFITEHYFENGEDYDKEIDAFENMRQLTRSPIRDEGGIELLFEYYNQLYFVDKRFFSAKRKLGVFFEWFDSISGKLTMQKAISFEKGSLLFNIGALYSHIAAHQKRSTEKEMLRAREYFQKAAGVLRHLQENFSHAPSTDMQPHTLKILVQIMLCQAQECHYDSVKLNADPQTTDEHISMSQHAALLYEMYRYARQQMHFDCVKDYIPHNWHILVQVKTLFFKAVSNWHAAEAIIATFKLQNEERQEKDSAVQNIFEPLSPSRISLNIPVNAHDLDDLAASRFFKTGGNSQRKYLAKACLSRSVLAHEEALRVHKQHQRVKRLPYYHDVHQLLKTSHDRCFKQYSQLEEEDDFTELSIVPNIKGMSDEDIAPIPPDFAKYKVSDYFHRLGPLAIFCAKHEWSAPLRVDMHKKSGQGFGFSVRGDSPVIIAEVDSGSLAEKAGMRAGDFIVQVDSHDVKWSKHDEVVKLIRAAGHRLVFSLITPLDKNYLKPSISVENSDNVDSDVKNFRTRARHKSSNSRSLDRSICRSEQARLSTKSTKSLTWTLKKIRGRQKNTLHVQEIMKDENIKNSR